MNPVLEISDLSFQYEEQHILNHLNLTVLEGEFVALIGENGAGKSTLFKLILGQLKGHQGTIKLFKESITDNPHYQEIAFISQHAVLNYKHFPTTVQELLNNHLIFLKKEKKLDYYLNLIGLNEHKNKALAELSGGQLQRVALALALIKDAKLIFLDEPTTGIDKKFVYQLFELLKELTRENKTIVMITHELEEITNFADKIYHLKKGSIHECAAYQWPDLMRM